MNNIYSRNHKIEEDQLVKYESLGSSWKYGTERTTIKRYPITLPIAAQKN